MGYLDGFGVILKKWFGVQTDSGARVTLEYPEEVRPKPERFHGRHVLNRYEDGMEKCIGCELCAAVCPAKCIYVRGKDNDPEDPTSPGERFGYVYEINYLRCIHCDLCVEACPTEAITETKLFEFSFTNREDAIYTKNELLVGDDGRPKQLPWENWDGGFDPARDTSGWMRATAPQGDHDFKNIVAWAGELGYGVRPPERGDVLDEVGPVPSVAPAHDPHDAHIATTPDEGRGVDAVGVYDEASTGEGGLFAGSTADAAGTAFGDAATAPSSGHVSLDAPTIDDRPDGAEADDLTVPRPEGNVDEADLRDAARFDSDGGSGTRPSAGTVGDDDGAAADAATITDDEPDASPTAGTTDLPDLATVPDEADAEAPDADVAAATFDAGEGAEEVPEPEQPRAPGHFDADDVDEPEKGKKKGRFRR